MSTISPRLRVGTRHCFTYARNIGPFMAPSITNGAVIPRRRKAPTKVTVFQAPCGAYASSRSPRGARPRSRTIAVLVQVSSMNTSRAGSNMPCSRIQRRRARATSARFCSCAYRLFFKADVVPIEEPPHRTAAAGNSSLAHRCDDLVQRQVRLLLNQIQQKLRMRLQPRGAAATWFCRNASGLLKALHPNHHHTGADAIAFRRFTPRGTRLNIVNHAATKVDGIRFRHHSLPKTNQCRRLAL